MFPAELTPQAAGGYRRSVAGRLSRHLRAWGLLADVVPLQPSPTLEEHRERKRQHAEARWRTARAEWARAWIEARSRLRALPRERALQILAEWHARADGGCGPDEFLRFLGYREPSAELIAHRRGCRRQNAVRVRERARREFTYYVEHVNCPEGELGTAEMDGMKRLSCIICERKWSTRSVFTSALEAGELRIVDCRLAEQLEFA